MSEDGWKFCRNRGEAQDWWRPGKTRGSISGTVNYGGSGTLRIFSTNAMGLQAESSYDKFAYLCATRFGDDPVAAAKGLCPEKVLSEKKDTRPVDISAILGEDRSNDFDDDEFCLSMVPDSGIIRMVYDYYCETAHRLSPVMGLAVAVSLCQTIFGRRVSSHTNLSTNDYNVVMAPTASGKEACETVLLNIFAAADINCMPVIPPDVQSGNGLMTAIAASKCAIWICDEFGKVLEAVLDSKGNGHVRQIGTHLLKLYGKSHSVYGGAAHAAGIKNQIIQPHLCLLGLTTGQVFGTIDSKQVQDGLLGRLAFWPVQTRPKRRAARISEVPEELATVVRNWIHYQPTSFNPEFPTPKILEMEDEALQRWEHHSDAIDRKMEHESESRAAIWGRVAARALKLAVMHRCSVLNADPLHVDWNFVRVGIDSIDWGIKVANWLGRIACGLIRENVVDMEAHRATTILMKAVHEMGEVNRRNLMREFRSVTGPEFTSAAESLQRDGVIEIIEIPTGGRPKVVYKLAQDKTADL